MLLPKDTEGLIIDMDGTILDTMPMWFNIERDYELAGFTADEIRPSQSDMIDYFYINKAVLKEGVFEFLSGLKRRNIKTCLATTTERHLFEPCLKRCGVFDFFDATISCSEVGAGKNLPLIYNAAFSLLGTSKENTYVLEDTYDAATTAKNAGFNVIGVFDSYSDKEKRIKKVCDVYVMSVSEL